MTLFVLKGEAQQIKLGIIPGVTKGFFHNQSNDFDPALYDLSSGASPMIGAYIQRSFGKYFINGEVHLASHSITFDHQINDPEISYSLRFSEKISQIQFMVAGGVSLNAPSFVDLLGGIGMSSHTFTTATWIDNISINGADSLFYEYRTTDNVGKKKWIPEAFAGIAFNVNRKIWFLEGAALRFTYHYLFAPIMDTPTEYSLTYSTDKTPPQTFSANWHGKLSYLNVGLILRVL